MGGVTAKKKWARGTHDHWAKRLLDEGWNAEAIAKELGFPPHTVKMHLKRILTPKPERPKRDYSESRRQAKIRFEMRAAEREYANRQANESLSGLK